MENANISTKAIPVQITEGMDGLVWLHWAVNEPTQTRLLCMTGRFDYGEWRLSRSEQTVSIPGLRTNVA
jgi:hypothetical protein